MLLAELKDKLNNVFFDRNNIPNEKVTFGHIVFQPGDRVPKAGYTRHDQDEYSYVVRGKARSVINGVETVISEGKASFIPAGEEHYTFNDGDEPFVVVYALVER